MKDDDIERPQAMKIRQGIQDAITYSLPDKKFNENKIDLVELDIELNNLGWNFHNFRILNLTDIHLGQWINPEYLDELVDYVNTLNIDLITLTGDYFSYVVDDYEKSLEKSFKKLDAEYGKFGVLGNHDHWMGADKVRTIFKNSNIIDLSNDVYTLQKGDDYLNLAGVDSCTVCADNLVQKPIDLTFRFQDIHMEDNSLFQKLKQHLSEVQIQQNILLDYIKLEI